MLYVKDVNGRYLLEKELTIKRYLTTKDKQKIHAQEEHNCERVY
jgi:hypothetical protein